MDRTQEDVPSASAAKRRVLVCAPFPPRLDARHGGKAPAQLLLRLAIRNEVGLLCLRAPDDEGVDPAIAARCAVVREVSVRRPSRATARRAAWTLGLLRGLPPWATDCRSSEYATQLAQLLDEWRPEVVEIHLQAMAQYVDAAASRGIPSVLVDYDPPSAWAKELERRAGGLRRLARRAEVATWRRYERRTRPRFDAIVVFAERDVAAVAPSAGAASIVWIPLAVEVPPLPLDPVGVDPPAVLFVGGFKHPPNVDAALWLGTTLFPRVRVRVPGARLEIVGHEPTDDVRALAGADVSVRASVPDVTPYLDRAAVVVAPIRLGGSMRMKVLEALAAGKALVATPRAAESVEAVPGEHFLLARDDDEFVDMLVELLDDRERRRTLASSARAWAEEQLGWERGAEAFEQVYDAVRRRERPPPVAGRRPRSSEA
jgi:glycosyltransferase involved in cell wall biosynthesis